MAENFYTILTALGKSKLANATILGNKVNFRTIKVGDSNGEYYEPSENQISLINKVWEGNINSISVDKSNVNWIAIETIIPASDGGFFIREAGIFDEDGDLIAISKISETYKPIISEGSTKDLSIKIILEIDNTDNVTLKIDPNVTVASKSDIQVLELKIQDTNAQLSDLMNKLSSDENDSIYQVAGGTATALTLPIQNLVNGYSKTFIASANNNGAAITINGKPLYKPGTTTAPNLIAGKAYTVWYNSTGGCFFIKASAEGNTIASHVLAGDTFSNDTDIGLVGTIPSKTAATYTPGTTDQTISANQYLSGAQTIKGDTNLVAGNIKAGVSLFGVAGKTSIVDTADATVAASQMISGTTAYKNGAKITGTMPYVNPDYADQRPCTNITAGASSGDGANYAYMGVPNGNFLNGVNWVRSYQPYLLQQYIVNGANIFGVAGSATPATLGGKNYVTGSVTVSTISTDVTTVTLGWQPTMITAKTSNGRYEALSPFVSMHVARTSYNRESGTNLVITSTGFTYQFGTLDNGESNPGSSVTLTYSAC